MNSDRSTSLQESPALVESSSECASDKPLEAQGQRKGLAKVSMLSGSASPGGGRATNSACSTSLAESPTLVESSENTDSESCILAQRDKPFVWKVACCSSSVVRGCTGADSFQGLRQLKLCIDGSLDSHRFQDGSHLFHFQDFCCQLFCCHEFCQFCCLDCFCSRTMQSSAPRPARSA